MKARRSAGLLVLLAIPFLTSAALYLVAVNTSARTQADGEIAVQIAAGGNHMCLLTDMGAVKCVGSNYTGQLGDGTTERRLTPVQVVGMDSGVTQIESGESISGNTCAIKSGSLFCWGFNQYGQLATGNTSDSTTPVLFQELPASVIQVSVGGSFTCVLVIDGTVWCAGSNEGGQLGVGSDDPDSCDPFPCSKTALNVSGLPVITAIAVGEFSACALSDVGQVFCWGHNLKGQLGTGSNVGPESCDGAPCSRSPVLAALPGPASAIAVGTNQTCAILAGAPYCWGDNRFNEAGPSNEEPCLCTLTPTKVEGIDDVLKVTAGAHHECFITATGDAYCLGANNWGQLGLGRLGSAPCYCEPAPQRVPLTSDVVDISAQSVQSCAVTADGRAFCAGADQVGQLGDDTLGDPACHCRYLMVGVVGFGGVPFCSQLQSGQSPTPTPLCPTVPPQPTPFGGLRGDADCDGTLNTEDALLDLKIMAGVVPRPTPRIGCFAPGDYNCDFHIDESDVLPILRAQAGIPIESPQPTQDSCGK